MQRSIRTLLFALMCAGRILMSAHAEVTIAKTEYKGWADAYKLSNGTVELIVVPSVGRIMRYGFVGGANMLWENPAVAGKPIPVGQWPNTGGDKIWPWPQDDWGKLFTNAWPPPPAADQSPHTADIVGGNALRLTSGVVAPWGIRIVREIRLASSGTRVSFINRFEKTGESDAPPVGVWTITQVPATSWVMARLHVSSVLTPLPGGYKSMSGNAKFKSVRVLHQGVLLVERNPAAATKIGVDGDILATLQGDTLFTVQRSAKQTADNAGGAYVSGDRLQFYSHPDNSGVPPYIEMEMTSPTKKLKTGETLTLNSVWELRRLPAEKRAPEDIADIIR